MPAFKVSPYTRGHVLNRGGATSGPAAKKNRAAWGPASCSEEERYPPGLKWIGERMRTKGGYAHEIATMPAVRLLYGRIVLGFQTYKRLFDALERTRDADREAQKARAALTAKIESQSRALQAEQAVRAEAQRGETDLFYEEEAPEPPLAASFFLTVEEARKKLVDLRENEIKPAFPDSDPLKGILRESMLEALLKHRPNNKNEWSSRIPLSLREESDGKQAREFLPKIFEILDEIAA